MTRRPWSAALACLSLCGVAFAQPAKRSEPVRFSVVVGAHFDAWDADRNATLSPEEIDKLVVDLSIHGNEAAALAAMKLVVRSTKIKAPALTREFVSAHSEEPAGELIDQPTKDAPGARPARPPSSLQRRYESALRSEERRVGKEGR